MPPTPPTPPTPELAEGRPPASPLTASAPAEPAYDTVRVEHVVGDLFEQRDVYALAHGVNCVGRMGAGIATEFRRRWPKMFAEYAQACRAGELRPGSIFAYQISADRWVYNLATQHAPGRDARLDAVADSLRAALAHARAHQVASIALPRIGAGIGGLDWRAVAATIEKVACEPGAPPVLLRTVSRPSDRPLPEDRADRRDLFHTPGTS